MNWHCWHSMASRERVWTTTTRNSIGSSERGTRTPNSWRNDEINKDWHYFAKLWSFATINIRQFNSNRAYISLTLPSVLILRPQSFFLFVYHLFSLLSVGANTICFLFPQSPHKIHDRSQYHRFTAELFSNKVHSSDRKSLQYFIPKYKRI